MCLKPLPGDSPHARRCAGLVLKACQMCAKTEQRPGNFLSFSFPCLARLVPQYFGDSFLLVPGFLAHKGQMGRYDGSAPGSRFLTSVTHWPMFQHSIGFRFWSCWFTGWHWLWLQGGGDWGTDITQRTMK